MYYRAKIKQDVKQRMKEHWQTILLVVVMISVVKIAVQVVAMQNEAVGELLGVLIGMPFDVAVCYFMMQLMKYRTVETGDFFEAFGGFFKWLLAGIWYAIWIFLWTLLFIIPGIVKSFAYSMYPYILAEYKEADVIEALRTSKRMTNGYKAELFTVWLSFLGWMIFIWFVNATVVALVIGGSPLSGMLLMDFTGQMLATKASIIATMVSMPLNVLLGCYITGTMTQIYQDLKKTALKNGSCKPEEFGWTQEEADAFCENAEAAKTVFEAEGTPADEESIYYEDDESKEIPLDQETYLSQKENAWKK